jgi:hypothetical protein
VPRSSATICQMHVRRRDLIDAVDWVASSQMGLITAAQLAEIGIANSTLSDRIRTGGPWRRVLPGIYLIPNDPISVEQRDMAALLFAGCSSVLTGTSALRRHGVNYLPGDPTGRPVHVLIPAERHRKSSGFVIVERTMRPPQSSTPSGLPTAGVARAVIDAGRRLTDRRLTRAIVLDAVNRNLTDVESLQHELRRAQRRGTALLRDALGDAAAGVRSAPEAEFRDLARQLPIPEPLWNPIVLRSDGTFLAMPDALIEESMVAIELDSKEFHSEGEAWSSTLTRGSEMTASGLIVLHVVPNHMRRNPRLVTDQVMRSHAQGLARPCPDLIVKPAH